MQPFVVIGALRFLVDDRVLAAILFGRLHLSAVQQDNNDEVIIEKAYAKSGLHG